MENKNNQLETNTKLTKLCIFPINNLYYYDVFYMNSLNHINKFVQVISDITNKEMSLEDALELCRNNTSNDSFIKQVSNRLKFLPYVYIEFLQALKERGILVSLVYREEEELEIIKLECEFLKIQNLITDFININTITHYSIVISDKVEELLEIKQMHINTLFTIFNFQIADDNEEYTILKNKNLEILKSINSDKYVNIYPDLVIESMRQSLIFIEYVHKYLNYLPIEEIRKGFFENSVKVLYIFDSKSTAKSYRKRELATSSENIQFTPFMFKNNWNISSTEDILNLAKPFDVVLQRCPYLFFKDPKFCKDFQLSLDKFYPQALVLHNMSVIETCFSRFNVYTLLVKFVKDSSELVLNKFGIKLNVPMSFSFSINENESWREVKENLLNKIQEFPVIIKPDSCTVHEMLLILNEEGLNTFINESNYSTRLRSKDFICQKFISHGGEMIKNYYLNNKSVSITRPSLPDLKGNVIKMDHFKDGSFTFHNEFLYQKQDPTFWEGVELNSSNQKFNLIEVNLEALNFISKLFADNTFITFFGLDYLFDRETNTYYLLEVNYFPSYREFGTQLRREFEEHIIGIYNKRK